MSGQQSVDNLVLSGPKGRIEYAVRRTGIMEAKEWLGNQEENVRAGFVILFMRLVRFGFIDNPQLFAKLKGMKNVWEFRKGPNRLFCINDGETWLLTHHYPKGHSKNHQAKSAKHAIAIVAEHHSRQSRSHI